MSTPIVNLHPGEIVTVTATLVFKGVKDGLAQFVTLEHPHLMFDLPHTADGVSQHASLTVERHTPVDGVPRPGEVWADAQGSRHFAVMIPNTQCVDELMLIDAQGIHEPWRNIHAGPLGPIWCIAGTRQWPGWERLHPAEPGDQPFRVAQAALTPDAPGLPDDPPGVYTTDVPAVGMLYVNIGVDAMASAVVRDLDTGQVIEVPGGPVEVIAPVDPVTAATAPLKDPIPIPRSQVEILARIAAAKIDLFGTRAETLATALTYENAITILDPAGFTAEDWQANQLHTIQDVVAAARDYLPFAIGKALNHRGLSAYRSIDHLTEWAWLAGRDDVVAAIHDGAYENYGVPKLRLFANGLELDWPDDPPALSRMAGGLPCSPGCESGCGR